MKTLVVLICCLTLSVATLGRCKDRNDYIVLNNNDTLYGRVTTFVSFKNQTWVKLKNNEGKKRYPMADVKALNVRCEDYWRQSYMHARRPEEGYLKVLVAGKMNLFYRYCPAARRDYHLYIQLENGNMIDVGKRTFNEVLLPILQRSETFRKQTETTGARFAPYSPKYMQRFINYVTWYNQG